MNCGRHSPDEIAFLDAERERARQLFVGQEQEFLCADCGAHVWADALARWDDPDAGPVHCDWEMVGLPSFRAAEQLPARAEL